MTLKLLLIISLILFSFLKVNISKMNNTSNKRIDIDFPENSIILLLDYRLRWIFEFPSIRENLSLRSLLKTFSRLIAAFPTSETSCKRKEMIIDNSMFVRS